MADVLCVLRTKYGARMRAYLRHAGISGGSELSAAVDDAIADAFIECCDLSPTEDLWPVILRALRPIAASSKREARQRAATVPMASADEPPTLDREQLWEWETGLLSKLPFAQRAALEWHVMDDVDDRTIASKLDVPVNRVRVLRHRATEKIRRLISSGEIESPPDVEDTIQ
jgi:hypothetical protein